MGNAYPTDTAAMNSFYSVLPTWYKMKGENVKYFICTFIYSFVYLFICLFIYLFIYSFIYIYLSIYLMNLFFV